MRFCPCLSSRRLCRLYYGIFRTTDIKGVSPSVLCLATRRVTSFSVLSSSLTQNHTSTIINQKMRDMKSASDEKFNNKCYPHLSKESISSHITKKERVLHASWDLREMLFSLKDYHTDVVTHMDPTERIRGLKLLEGWMIDKIVVKSGWIRDVGVAGDLAKQFWAPVGEQRILRYLLSNFLANESIWRDELTELMQSILGGAETLNKPLAFNDNDVVVIPSTLLVEPKGIKFYSKGVYEILVEFLSDTTGSFFSGSNALWRTCVVSQRNSAALSSPHCPPFGFGEIHLFFTEGDFEARPSPSSTTDCDVGGTIKEEVQLEEVPLGSDGNDGLKLYVPKEPNTSDGLNSGSKVRKATGDDESWRSPYLRDAFYMRLIDPVNEETSNITNSQSSLETEFKGVASDEVEDPHLASLWDIFRNQRTEEIIDTHRAVRADAEEMKREVFLDILARKALLLLFFSRDEVRLVTNPLVTYQRLSTLHRELRILAALHPFGEGKNTDVAEPPPFHDLSVKSRVSFSFFGQSHAPLQRWLYRACISDPSAENLYNSYCKLRPKLSEESSKTQDLPLTESTKKSEKGANKDSCLNIKFQQLSEVQQMAFKFPFDIPLTGHASAGVLQKREGINEQTGQEEIGKMISGNFNLLNGIDEQDNAGKGVGVQRGRTPIPRDNHGKDTPKEATIKVVSTTSTTKKRGRPKRTTAAEAHVAVTSPPIKKRGRPKSILKMSSAPLLQLRSTTRIPPLTMPSKDSSAARSAVKLSAENAEMAPRQRGRPRKVPLPAPVG